MFQPLWCARSLWLQRKWPCPAQERHHRDPGYNQRWCAQQMPLVWSGITTADIRYQCTGGGLTDYRFQGTQVNQGQTLSYWLTDLCFLKCGKSLSVGLLPQSLRILLKGHVWVRRPASVGVCRALKYTVNLKKGEKEIFGKKRITVRESHLADKNNSSNITCLFISLLFSLGICF